MDKDLGLGKAHCEFKIMGANFEKKGSSTLISEKVIYFQKQRKNFEDLSQPKKDGKNKPTEYFKANTIP